MMLTPKDSILVVVDVQGKLAQIVNDTEKLHANLKVLIQGLRLFDIPTLWLEHLPDKLGPTSPIIAEELMKTSRPISKQHFSGWQCEAFKDRLLDLNRKEIILVGIETHICVYQTARELLENHFNVHLVADALSSRTMQNNQLGIEMMRQNGAQITNIESLLFELQNEAFGDRFKQLLSLIK